MGSLLPKFCAEKRAAIMQQHARACHRASRYPRRPMSHARRRIMDSAKVAEQLQTQVDSARKQIRAAVKQSSQKLTELRHKAADAALHWVLAHDDRVKS